MKGYRILTMLFLCVLVSIGTVRAAPVTYTYIGNPFASDTIEDLSPPDGTYTTSDFVTISMTLPEALTPNSSPLNITPMSYSASDGRSTLVSTDLSLELEYLFYIISTDDDGMPAEWGIRVYDRPSSWPEIGDTDRLVISYYSEEGGPYRTVDGGRIGEVIDIVNGSPTINYDYAESNTVGSWSATSVPDASIMLLLGSSLLGLGVFSKKSKKS